MVEPVETLDCHHYDAHRCRSCALLPQPYATQLAGKLALCESLLDIPQWLPPVTSPIAGFRNKAKMVVAGTVTERNGELKHVLTTCSPQGQVMVRFVLRSREAETRIRKHLPWLLTTLPSVQVVSLNLQPEHKAVLEGADEIVLTEQSELPMQVGDRSNGGVELRLRPQSFFQTNTAVASALYRTATAWADELAPASVLDLYCGVGGFALHLADPGRQVTGVEISPEAIESAQSAARDAGLTATFRAADATGYTAGLGKPPDLVVLNPPRRGIGDALATWLETSGVPSVLYSSCHAESLAKDLARMPSLRPVRGLLLDMFPHTRHFEVLVQLER